MWKSEFGEKNNYFSFHSQIIKQTALAETLPASLIPFEMLLL